MVLSNNIKYKQNIVDIILIVHMVKFYEIKFKLCLLRITLYKTK